MRRNFTALALLLALAAPVAAQQQGLWPPSLTLDPSPPGTAVIPIWYPDQTRAKKVTFSIFRAGLFDLTTVGAGNLVWATPNGTTGIFSARALVAADIPTLAYVASLSMPADFSVTGTTALTVSRVSQSANLFNASPSGSSGTPTYRAITLADFPTIVTAKLLGSVSGSTAAPGAVTVGTGLSLAGGTLSSTATVTSVALALPSWLTVTGSPVTTSGTLTGAAATGQTTGRVIGTCAGATSFAPCQLSLTTDVTGTLPAAQFPALTGAITTSAGSLATSFAAGQTIGTVTLNSPTIGTAGSAGSSHLKFAGTSPSVSCTGLGTGGTSAIVGPDAIWSITLTAGTSAASSGTCTVTFNGNYLTNVPICIAALTYGTGTWSSSSTVIETAESLTAPQFTWTNSNQGALVGLVNTSTYKINGFCGAR